MLDRSQRRFAGWLAAIAVTLQFLAPLVSQAIASWSGAPEAWQQVCTVQGSSHAWASDASSSPTHDDDASGLLGHCPLCLLHVAHWAPTPQLAAAIPESGAEPPLSKHDALAPEPRLVWESPQSRAPPTLS
jgi:hypothetical protein